MRIDLKNEQFAQFVNFARKAKSDTQFAQLGDPVQDAKAKDAAPLDCRTIIPKKQGDSIGRFFRLGRSRTTNNQVRDKFMQTVLEMCGVSNVNALPEKVKTAMLLKDYGHGKPLTARRIIAVNTALKEEAAEQLAKNAAAVAHLAPEFGFKGQAAGTLAGICIPGSGLENSPNPSAELKQRINTNGKSFLQYLALNFTCRKVGDNIVQSHDQPLESFKLDFYRCAPVTINGVKYQLSSVHAPEEVKKAEFKKVCDAFVQFITGDKNATFEAASRDVKIRANVLMGYANQAMDAVIMASIGNSFDLNPTDSRFSMLSHGGTRVQNYEISKDENGKIKVGYSMELSAPIHLQLKDEAGNGKDLVDKTGSGGYGFTMKIDLKQLENFGKADWDHIENQKVIDLWKIRNKEAPGWMTKLTTETPENYGLKIDEVDFSYHVTVNNLERLGE